MQGGRSTCDPLGLKPLMSLPGINAPQRSPRALATHRECVRWAGILPAVRFLGAHWLGKWEVPFIGARTGAWIRHACWIQRRWGPVQADA